MRIPMLDRITPKEFAVGGGTLCAIRYGVFLFHEYCHLAAIKVLFTNSNPYVVMGYPSCLTVWEGKEKALLRPEFPITRMTGEGIVYAAGPIAEMSHVVLSSVLAWKARNHNKKIAFLFATNAFA